MASPQTENGYTRISNELLEAFCFVDMPNSAQRVFLGILRKTYGYQKKEDRMSVSQLMLVTNLQKRRVQEAIAWLKKNKMITREKKTWMTGIVKNYEEWKPLSTRGGSAEIRTMRKSAPRSAEIRTPYPVRKSAPTKETYKRNYYKRKATPVENLKSGKGKRPYIEGDPAFQDPVTRQWRVKIHSGEWVDYVGNTKPEWR